MSSARKRSAIAKAKREADFQRQRAFIAECHANVMQGFAEMAARKADTLQAQLDALMIECRRDEMTDTEIIDWMQQNATAIREDINERMTVTWLDKSGIPRTTEGDNIRDCVRGAIAKGGSSKDESPEDDE